MNRHAYYKAKEWNHLEILSPYTLLDLLSTQVDLLQLENSFYLKSMEKKNELVVIKSSINVMNNTVIQKKSNNLKGTQMHIKK